MWRQPLTAGSRQHRLWNPVTAALTPSSIATHTRQRTSSTSTSSWQVHQDTVKPFSAIPGPVKLPILGTLLPYKLGWHRLQDYHKHVVGLHHRYGPLVREVFGSEVVVHVFHPDDVRTVYESDGRTPYVPPLQETTQLYRQQKEMSPGLGNINGEEWYRLRHAVQAMMLRPREVSHYLPLQDNVAQAAVDRLTYSLDPYGVPHDLPLLLGKWILESAGMCCFERSLGCLGGGPEEDLAQRLVEANMEIFKLSAELKFSLRLYRYFKTPKYKKLHDLEDFFYGVSQQFIEEALEHVKARAAETKQGQETRVGQEEYAFLGYLLGRTDLSMKDIFTITLSLFSDGLSTTAPTLLGCLHCLALWPEVQQQLYEHLSTNLDPSQPLSPSTLARLSYLKAFVKEVFRFYPIGESVQRFPQRDLVLRGYHVPAGTYLDLNSYVWLRSEHYFPQPERLWPERWMRDNPHSLTTAHPYVLNPFSMGTRMCAGRRFAEQDLYAGLSRLLLKFRVEATEGRPPSQEWRTLLRPTTPLPIKLVPRH